MTFWISLFETHHSEVMFKQSQCGVSANQFTFWCFFAYLPSLYICIQLSGAQDQPRVTRRYGALEEPADESGKAPPSRAHHVKLMSPSASEVELQPDVEAQPDAEAPSETEKFARKEGDGQDGQEAAGDAEAAEDEYKTVR